MITFVNVKLNLLTMILFPNAKINIGLNIVSKRSDGYHNLETVFYPISWCDSLEIILSNQLQFTSTGLNIPGSGNLCLDAYQLLKSDFDLSPVHIHLHKNIPIGAGLGGGSSDASFTLKGLNELFDLNLSDDELKKYALKLGADCPFFIDNIPSLATGIGEELSPISLDLDNLYLMVVTPNIHISTAQAYSSLRFDSKQSNLADLLKSPVEHWEMKNDFESGIFELEPKIASVKQKMIENGALYASMSGSGSSVYAIFKQKPNLVFDACKQHIQSLPTFVE